MAEWREVGLHHPAGRLPGQEILRIIDVAIDKVRTCEAHRRGIAIDNTLAQFSESLSMPNVAQRRFFLGERTVGMLRTAIGVRPHIAFGIDEKAIEWPRAKQIRFGNSCGAKRDPALTDLGAASIDAMGNSAHRDANVVVG